MGDTVAVETYSGDSAYGPLYGTSANVTCNVDSKRRLVRDSAGDEVVSEVTLQVASADETKFTPETRVTIAGRVSKVLAVNPRTYKGQVVYVEVNCA
jgi:hypothetical protein